MARAGEVISVGEAARRAGSSPKAVRLYEALGILTDVARTPSGYRMYTEAQVQLLRFVRRARALGLSLEEIRRLADAGRRAAPPCGTVVEVLERHVRRAEDRLAEVDRLRAALAGLLGQARARAGRGEAVRLCRLVEGWQGAGVEPRNGQDSDSLHRSGRRRPSV